MPQNDPPLLKNLGVVLLAIGTIALIVGGITVIVYRQQFGDHLSGEHAQWAEFGNYVGGVLGSLFALFGLIALLLTLWIQSTELRKSAEALSEQNSSIKLQNFENRFFNMISLHHEIVNGIDLRVNGKVTSSGRDCLRVFCQMLLSDFNSVLRGDCLNYKNGILSEYDRFYERHAHELGHYFRNIYRILKFIEESDAPKKTEYSGILRAQLSNPELALLFYNGIAARGNKLKPLAEKYALFENLEPDQLARKNEDYKFYEPEAFGENIGLFMGDVSG